MNCYSLLLLLASLTLTAAVPVEKPPKNLLTDNSNIGLQNGVYFATFKSGPGTPSAQKEQQEFREQVKALGIDIKERNSFTELVNAISFETDEDNLDRLSKISGIKQLFPMLTVTPPRLIKKNIPNMQLKYSHGMTGVKQVHDTMGYNGKGIKVGIIDSGVDYKHPALGGCFGKGCKVEFGYDFVGDDFGGIFNPPRPDDDPMDCNGHGTHVAGIIAAQDKDFVGVAPEATLGAYRIFGCEGGTSTDVIIKALEKTLADGMDVVNMSLGGPPAWASHPGAQAVEQIIAKGVTVVVAMGNFGEKGTFQAPEPGIAPNAITVASFDNLRYSGFGFTVGSLQIPYSSEDEKALEIATTEIAAALGPKDALACEDLKPETNLKGKVALVQRGTCSFTDKALRVQNAGAVAMIVFNNQDGIINPSAKGPGINIPAAGITKEMGEALLEQIGKSNGAVKIEFPKEPSVFDNPTGGRVSAFSNWGPGPELDMKPDLGAPGGLIYSTFPREKGSYATLSGTSMATPYMAGSLALYMQAKGKKNVDYRSVFQNTANPVNAVGLASSHPVFQQGAGLINVRSALLNPTTVSPSMMSIKSSDIHTGKLKPITLKNNGKTTITYAIKHQPAVSINPWDKSGTVLGVSSFKEAPVKVDISTKQITLRPGQEEKINLFFLPPSGISLNDNWLISGYIVVEPKLSAADMLKGVKAPPTLHVPYSGMHGNYRSKNIFNVDEELPVLVDGNTREPINNSTVLNFRAATVLAYRTIFTTRKVVLAVVDAETKKEIALIANGVREYLPTFDPEAFSFYSFLWKGDIATEDGQKPVADGKYRLRLKALRPLGREDKEAEWQTWETTTFEVKRNSTLTSDELMPTGQGLFFNKLKNEAEQESKKMQQLRAESDNLVLPQPNKILKASE